MKHKNLLKFAAAALLAASLTSCYVPRSGLFENDLGTRYYVKDVYQTGWIEIDSKTYYFSKEDGYMVTKSGKIGGVWYGINPDGTLADGFLKDDDGTRYYNKGTFLTGWQEIDGDTYYFYTENGIMAIGQIKIGGSIHYFSEDGKLLNNAGGNP